MRLGYMNLMILSALVSAASAVLTAIVFNFLMKRKRRGEHDLICPHSLFEDDVSKKLDPLWDSVELVNPIIIGDIQIAKAVKVALESNWLLPERFPIAQRLVKDLRRVVASSRGESCIAMDIWRKSDTWDGEPLYLGLLPGFMTPGRTYCFRWVDGQLALYKVLVPRDHRFGPVHMTGECLGFKVSDPRDSRDLAFRDEIVSVLRRRGLKSEDRYSDYFIDPEYIPPFRDRGKATPSWENWDRIAGIRESATFWDAGVFRRNPDNKLIHLWWIDGPWDNTAIAIARDAAEKMLPGRHMWRLVVGGATLVTSLRSDDDRTEKSLPERASDPSMLLTWRRSRAVLLRAIAAQRKIEIPDIQCSSTVPAPASAPDVFELVKDLPGWREGRLFFIDPVDNFASPASVGFQSITKSCLADWDLMREIVAGCNFEAWTCSTQELIKHIEDLEA